MAAPTAQELRDFLARNTSQEWLEGLQADPDSNAVLEALISIWERVGRSVDAGCMAGAISEAPAGNPGSSLVTMSGGAPASVLTNGTSFTDSRGVRGVITQDYTIPGSGELTPTVFTLRQSEIMNTELGIDPGWRFSPSFLVADASNAAPIVITTTGPHNYANGASIRISGVLGNTGANGVFTIAAATSNTFELVASAGTGTFAGGGLAQPAPFGLVIDSSTAIQGATGDWLSAHGNERGQQRQEGEPVSLYRPRVRNIADAVSPRAISEAVQGVADQQGLPFFDILEPFNDLSSATLDASLGLGFFGSLYYGSSDPGTVGTPYPYAWDEEISTLLGTRESCAYLQISPTAIPADPDDLRQFYDSTFFLDDGYLDVTEHPTLVAGLLAVIEEVTRKLAACVQFDQTIPAYTFLTDRGTTSSAAMTTVFTITPPAGKGWWVQEIIGAHGRAPGSTLPAAAGHQIRVTFEDATTLDLPEWVGVGSNRTRAEEIAGAGSMRIVQIDGRLRSDAVQTLFLYGVIRVLEVEL